MRIAQSDRAVGAMFFSIFGGAWLVLWTHRAMAGNPVVLAIVVSIATALGALALFRSRQMRRGVPMIEETPEKKRNDRIFHFVNAGQWILILVLGNVLANMHLSEWVIPLAIFVIGLHFIPLAHLFSFRGHYLTGSALIILAAVYPHFAAGGASDPVGCLGAGVILLLAAVMALTSNGPGLLVRANQRSEE
ncbi:hypothetical protein [Undibacterium sp.]|uniref:hypothetical protein n=1 Tax=Undibacterium sp. TaxID=1914977 RepID=UPI002BD64A2C|nr:hypothetical protein [Undibacterium sp.]HTD04248.1 hypothetical protein [Undibacterium sp.]